MNTEDQIIKDFVFSGKPIKKSGMPNVNRIINDPIHANGRSRFDSLPFRQCLIDSSGNQFVCIHQECQQHADCLDSGSDSPEPKFHKLCFHPEDLAILCEELYPDILSFMNTLGETEHNQYKFTYNHRYIREDGSISQFLQEGILSLNEMDKTPVIQLKVFTETGDLKTDNTMVLTIFRLDTLNGFQKVFSKIYCNKSETVLSNRELEIVRLCLKGLSSKMIADHLNLSIHTVKNHKRNCMEKTCTRNIAELLNVCMRKGWI